jgi:hypothetical protein
MLWLSPDINYVNTAVTRFLGRYVTDAVKVSERQLCKTAMQAAFTKASTSVVTTRATTVM